MKYVVIIRYKNAHRETWHFGAADIQMAVSVAVGYIRADLSVESFVVLEEVK